MIMVDQHGKIVLVNAEVERLFGYPRAELVGKPVEVLVPERFRRRHPGLRAGFHEAPQFRAMGAGRDLYGLHRDGSEVPIEIGLNPLRTETGDFVLSSVVDISERKRAEHEREMLLAQLGTLNAELEARVEARTTQLTQTLKEREVLLQEVHHRVKNNLQMVSSLINMQLRKLADGPNRAGLQECKSRVEAIALIHEKLYQSRDYAHVPFSEYARSLARGILHATGITPANITLDVDVESISLPVDKAIPCGLILNELITNALKHAFPDGRRGSVRIELQHATTGDLVLAVSDDGIGMAHELDPRRSASLGLQLVAMLVEQLHGRLELVRTAGMTFRITFPLDGSGPS
jgi:PAS domain S-box-containing protein